MSVPTATRAPRGARVAIQKLGTALSNMVLPNIGAFIAWGLITALFIEAGWITLVGGWFGYEGSYGLVERLGAWGSGADGTGIVGPMITYLLPLLIGYTGGRMAYKDTIRGGVVGAIATMGAVTGAEVPMFLGAMIMGPLGGWSMKKLDQLWEHKIRPGFEMLVNNFSAGIWGMLLSILGFVVAGPFVTAFSNGAEKVVDFLVDNSLLPFTSVLVEPAKVLFLNNAINHGVFTPLGTAESTTNGKSILFLIEANPGPGLGLLLAFMVFGAGLARASASGAALIHFVGGIHEIYFPYILMKPKLILAMIAGGMTGVGTNMVFDSGLRAPAAPGSIIAVLIQSPVGSLIGVILSVVLSATVTFVVAGFLLRFDKDKDDDLASATESMEKLKGKKSSVASALTGGIAAGPIRTIVFACDAGMGSSAMGASVLRRKIREAGFNDVTVENKAISNLKDEVDLVVTHQDLTERARQRTPSARHVSVENFMGSPRYDEVVELIIKSNSPDASGQTPSSGGTSDASTAELLALSAIKLDGVAATKAEAIDEAGALLMAENVIPQEYVAAMHERELSVSTYVGSGLAIPHGTVEAKELVQRTGLSFVRYSRPIEWNGHEVEFVIGIASKGNDHLDILAKVSRIFTDPKMVERLRQAETADEVQSIVSGVKA